MPELMVDFITSLDGYGAAEGWPGFWGLQGPEYVGWLGEQPEGGRVGLREAEPGEALDLVVDAVRHRLVDRDVEPSGRFVDRHFGKGSDIHLNREAGPVLARCGEGGDVDVMQRIVELADGKLIGSHFRQVAHRKVVS